MSLGKRLLVAALLVAVLGSLFVHAAATSDQRWPTPQADDLAVEYDRYVGAETFMFGTVVGQDGEGLAVRFDSHRGPVAVAVTDTDVTARPGATVQVAGTVGPDHTLRADRVIVVNDSRAAALYKYGVSLLGVALFVLAFFRYWRVDTDAWVFRVRGDG
ncbi:hypothetical protein [Haloarcula marina]|uniref:hypothetical protein n=1 Tax=Haloarcula marina TaxID=2961574 RepID=UPI0020B7821C|nr:hypothetical protein [Halomicroarcula marina]